MADGRTMEFAFGANGDGHPNVRIRATGKEDRTLAWDRQSKLILSDATPSSTWMYTVKPGANPRDYAAIERKDLKNNTTEGWWRDNSRGREEIQTSDGIKTIKTWFTSGILAGKPRIVEQVKDGETKTLVRYTYGEQGHLIRELKGDKTTLYKYDKDGNHVAATCDGQPIWERQYDQGKRMVKEVNFQTGTILTRSYSSNGQWEDIIDEKGKVSSTRYASDGKRLSEKLASGDQFSYEYDEQGRLKSRKYNQDLWEYKYDSNGRKTEVTVNGKPKEQYAYAPDGSWMEQKIYPKGGGAVETAFREEYDFSGRLIFEEMICDGKRETTIKYRYDGSGRLAEKDSSAEGLIQYQYANGQRTAVKVKKPEVKS
ncbi:MAG: hypothetical protein PHV34_06350 [Verrucomicrobiae bacterium]|nr:hypothetical protein [Verrucomicrobiae bacterium]